MTKAATTHKSCIKIHAVGAIVCVLIAVGSIGFAAHSVSKRRGLFLSTRHQLTNIKAELNNTIAQRASLATRVQRLQRQTQQQLKLVSVKNINARSVDIARLAESSEISVDSLQPLAFISDARVPVQPLELIGSAEADSVSQFLAQLAQSMPDIHIQSIELASESIGSEQVRLRLLMYWFVDPASDS